jgi:hypothetical protein
VCLLLEAAISTGEPVTYRRVASGGHSRSAGHLIRDNTKMHRFDFQSEITLTVGFGTFDSTCSVNFINL